MVDDWTLRVCEVLGDSDVRRSAIDVGGGSIHASADVYVLADGPRQLRFDLRYRAEDYRLKTQAIFWRGWFCFGFGGRAILWREQGAVEIDLGCYFDEFVAGDDYLLATSGRGIVRLAPDGGVVWRNDELGLDGVLIFDIEGDVIDGQGEWDPPGGWREFLVSLETGDTLEELPDDQDQDA